MQLPLLWRAGPPSAESRTGWQLGCRLLRGCLQGGSLRYWHPLVPLLWKSQALAPVLLAPVRTRLPGRESEAQHNMETARQLESNLAVNSTIGGQMQGDHASSRRLMASICIAPITICCTASHSSRPARGMPCALQDTCFNLSILWDSLHV